MVGETRQRDCTSDSQGSQGESVALNQSLSATSILRRVVQHDSSGVGNSHVCTSIETQRAEPSDRAFPALGNDSSNGISSFQKGKGRWDCAHGEELFHGDPRGRCYLSPCRTRSSLVLPPAFGDMLARPESDDASGQVGIIERDAIPTNRRRKRGRMGTRRTSNESMN